MEGNFWLSFAVAVGSIAAFFAACGAIAATVNYGNRHPFYMLGFWSSVMIGMLTLSFYMGW